MQVERWIEGDRNERMRFDKAPWTADKAAQAASPSTPPGWRIAFCDRRRLDHLLQRRAERRPRLLDRAGGPRRLRLLSASSPPRPTCWPAWRASRSAPSCAPGRASRARWSTATRSPSPTSAGAASRAASYKRGPERERRSATASTARQCVAVCPTGIDIRDGFQLECIGCGLCIDACDEVMEQDRPPAEAHRLRQRAQPGAARRRQGAGLPDRPAAHRPLRDAARRDRHGDAGRPGPAAERRARRPARTATRCSSRSPTAASATATPSG